MLSRIIFAFTGAVALPAALLFHAELKSSSPGRDAVLKAPPREVTLTFSERVNQKLSAIAILRPDSSEVMKLVLDASRNPRVLHAPLTRALPPGRYLVRYRTASADGHAVRGAFAFAVDVVE